MWFVLDIVTAELLGQASGSTFLNLPGEKLQNFEIPLAPLPEQRRIAAILNEQMAAVERARAACEAQLDAINHLPIALLRRAFDGEL